jgi:acyl-CoA dehydrogenase
MDFEYSAKVKAVQQRLHAFMQEHIYPNEQRYQDEVAAGDRWQPPVIIEELKRKARAAGLWNLFLPDSSRGGGLNNLEYAPLCEIMGRVHWSSEVFNCSAPDTGNMETLERYGTEAQKRQWLEPLLDGAIRSSFAMTEPGVASSDATNIQSRIERQGDHYVINGHKWWATGAPDRRCKLLIVMGKTDPDNPDRHRQQSMILVPREAPGVTVRRWLPVFGFDHAPHGHGEVLFENVKVPVTNILLGEGRGFEIAQGRLGPGRVHHCMRAIGQAEVALEKTCRRLNTRVAFGKPLAEQSVMLERIARSADRDRPDSAVGAQGRRHDGQARQQGGARRDRDDQGCRAEYAVPRARPRHPGLWRRRRYRRLRPRRGVRGGASAAHRRRSG